MLRTEISFGSNGRVNIESTPIGDFDKAKENEVLIYNCIGYISRFFYNQSEGAEAVEMCLRGLILSDERTDFLFENNFYGAAALTFSNMMTTLPTSKLESIGKLAREDVVQPPIILTNNPHMNDGVSIDKKKYKYKFQFKRSSRSLFKLKLGLFSPNDLLYPLSVISVIEYTLVNIDSAYNQALRDCLQTFLELLESKKNENPMWLLVYTDLICESHGLKI